jgi:hypothetical protein
MRCSSYTTASERSSRHRNCSAGLGIALAMTVALTGCGGSKSAVSVRAPAPAASGSSSPFVMGAAVTETTKFRDGNTSLAPPLANDSAAVDANAAFTKFQASGIIPHTVAPYLTSTPSLQLTRATVLDWGKAHADGSVTPFILNRLVWAVWYKSVTMPDPQGGPSRAGAQTGSAPPTVVVDVLTFVDASTGVVLDTEVFSVGA